MAKKSFLINLLSQVLYSLDLILMGRVRNAEFWTLLGKIIGPQQLHMDQNTSVDHEEQSTDVPQMFQEITVGSLIQGEK